jgi:purine-binding chemotaxis protein CheW
MDKDISLSQNGYLSSKRTREQSFVTMRVNGQLFGASVYAVQDILRRQTVTRIPLAPPMVQGALNLRGRIVTAINMYRRLDILTVEPPAQPMHVVLDFKGELYSLMVDSVGDVLSLPLEFIDKAPVNLPASWRDITAGVYRLQHELLVLFDIQALLEFQPAESLS